MKNLFLGHFIVKNLFFRRNYRGKSVFLGHFIVKNLFFRTNYSEKSVLGQIIEKNLLGFISLLFSASRVYVTMHIDKY